MRRQTILPALMLPLSWLALFIPVASALAQTGDQTNSGPAAAAPMLSTSAALAERDGAELYANICQACHMPDGQGATGAGIYPSLAADANLAGNAYPIHMVINGKRAMPPFGKMLSDAQIAAVVNYVRSHFGNTYADIVTAKDVAAGRR
jgi:mono/diheme cytochrome c family protein